MAFSTGTTTSLTDFITVIGDFAIGQAGFTRTTYTNITFSSTGPHLSDPNTWNTTGEGSPTNFTVTILSKVGSNVHWAFVADDSNGMQSIQGGATTGDGNYYFESFLCYSNTGISSSTTYVDVNDIKTNLGGGQSITSGFTCYKDALTSSSYWLYTNGSEVHCVLEVKTNLFNHLSFGEMVKYNSSWTGGEYMTSGFPVDRQSGVDSNRYQGSAGSQHYPFQEDGQTSVSSCYVYNEQTTPVDSTNFARIGYTVPQDNQMAQMGIDTGVMNDVPAEGSYGGFLGELLLFGNNSFNLRAPLIPIYVRLRDFNSTSTSASSRDNVFNIVGEFERVRLVNITNLTPKTIVDTDWRVFPLVQKAGGDDEEGPITNFYGLAYREI